MDLKVSSTIILEGSIQLLEIRRKTVVYNNLRLYQAMWWDNQSVHLQILIILNIIKKMLKWDQQATELQIQMDSILFNNYNHIVEVELSDNNNLMDSKVLLNI